MGDALEYRRLRAPRDDGGILVEPPIAAFVETLEAGTRSAAASDYDLQGRSLGSLAGKVREQLVARALSWTRQYRDVPAPKRLQRIVLAGHQPQLFHPGVWFKNFVLSAVAQRVGAVAVNLIIDSDTIKTASLRVPGGSVGNPRMESVAYDHQTGEIPYEQRQIVDRGLFESFGSRASRVLEPLVPHPLLQDFWPLAVQRSAATSNLGACLAQARHQLEGQWGARTLEVPQSEICGLEAFHWFTSHLLAHLPRFWELYNSTVADYRRVNHIRSSAHPVPDLELIDDWIEAPFWIWQDSDPSRRPVFVRQRGEQLILSDRGRVEVPLSLSAESDAQAAVDQLAALAQQGIKLRTRALITTMFARLMLGDAFLHGIGGAKYDQVTDVLIARFFGIEPPPYMTVTATLRLPIEHRHASPQDAEQLSRQLRDVEFHPERYFDESADGQVGELIQAKVRWIRTPQTPENARVRFAEIRRINEALQERIEPLRRDLIGKRNGLTEDLRGESILSAREYAFCLYPEEPIRALMARADAQGG